jgi:hypothetical protein
MINGNSHGTICQEAFRTREESAEGGATLPPYELMNQKSWMLLLACGVVGKGEHFHGSVGAWEA